MPRIETEVAEQARNRVAVNIDINEGSVARIKHINIVGNTVYEDRDLVDLFELKTTGWFSWLSGNDKYSREKLNGGLESLSSYYLDRGYIRFNIDSTQVAITPDRSAVYITVNVTEGEKYKVTKVDLSGDIVIPESEMRGFLLLRDGQDFSQVQVTNTEEMITQRLGVEGYTFAKVNGIPEIDDENKTVALKFFVDPGKRTYVRRIEFRGNTKSVDEVLRREMRQMESAPASSAQIEQSRVRVERLGFFKEVKTENVPVPGTDDMIDVQYTVEEQSSGSIGASVGYAQDAGLILGANLQQNNFLGTGKQVGIGLNSSKYQDLYSFNYVNPYYTPDGVSRGFSVFYRSTDLEEINVASYTTDTIGGTMSFGYPISETQRLGLSLGVNRTDISAGIGAVQEISGSPRPIDDAIGYTRQDELNDFGYPDLENIRAPVPDEFFKSDIPTGFLDIYGDSFDNFLVTGSWSQFALNRGQLATRGYSQNLSLQVATPAAISSTTSSPTTARSSSRCGASSPCACAAISATATAGATPMSCRSSRTSSRAASARCAASRPTRWGRRARRRCVTRSSICRCTTRRATSSTSRTSTSTSPASGRRTTPRAISSAVPTQARRRSFTTRSTAATARTARSVATSSSRAAPRSCSRCRSSRTSARCAPACSSISVMFLIPIAVPRK
jgi:outer membrane protein insertion porin family